MISASLEDSTDWGNAFFYSAVLWAQKKPLPAILRCWRGCLCRRWITAPTGAERATCGGGISGVNQYDYSKSFEDFKNGRIPERDTLLVGPTPDLYRKIGLSALPITINKTYVEYALYGTKDADHFIGEENLKQLPETIKNPVAVFTSETHEETSIIALLPFEANGNQMFMPVVVDGYGTHNSLKLDSNAITSVYGKSSADT